MTPSLLLLLVISLMTPATTRSADKYLIEFGWDEPTPAFMRKHVAEMEQTPFDGTVYHVLYQNPDGTTANFMNACWGTRAFTDAELQNAIDDLRATPFKRFHHNFLRFNVLPGTVDWFDDFGAIETNARHAARIARAGGGAGVLFDIEQYEFHLFNYSNQRDAKTKSWDDYAEQAHARGQQIMRAFQAGWKQGPIATDRPLTVFLTFGLSLPRQQCEGDRAKLKDADYGLLAPFLEGMYAVADKADVIVDGYEFAYGYRDEAQFAHARDLVLNKLPTFAADGNKYRAHTSLGFGLWLDYDWRKHGYDEHDPSKNYFPPEAFEQSLRLASQHADRYVWVYTESPKWWTDAGTSEKLPGAYDAALRRARGK
jgi:hypothetical protein